MELRGTHHDAQYFEILQIFEIVRTKMCCERVPVKRVFSDSEKSPLPNYEIAYYTDPEAEIEDYPLFGLPELNETDFVNENLQETSEFVTIELDTQNFCPALENRHVHSLFLSFLRPDKKPVSSCSLSKEQLDFDCENCKKKLPKFCCECVAHENIISKIQEKCQNGQIFGRYCSKIFC